MNLFRRVVAVLIVVLRWSVDRCVLALVAVALMTSLSAADRTWDGGGGDDNWTTPANWDGDVTAPSAGDNLIFTGTTRTTPNNNFAADTAFGSITFDNTAGAFTIGGNRIVLSGSITNDDGDLQTLNLAIGGNFIVTGSSGAITLNGNISAGSPVTKNGSHVLTLGGTGDNSGVGLTANAGTVILAKTSSASVHAIGGSTLTINSGATVQLGGTGGDQIYFTGNVVVDAGGVFDVNGLSEMINGLSGAGSVLNAGGGTATLTVGGNGASTTFSGTLSNSSGTLALAKMGTGTWTLSGANTYTGATTVGAGTLLVTGSTAAGSAVSVSFEATLGGTGTVAGTIAMAVGAILAPGTGGSTIGTLTTGAVTFITASTYSVDLNGTTPTYDQISTAGTVTCTGATLTVGSIANATLGRVYTIINAGTVSGTFYGLPNGAMFHRYGRIFQIAYTATTVTLTDVGSTTRVWDGGGGNDNWTTAANWDNDVAPLAGTDLVFAGSTRLTPNNDFPAETSFASITFNSGAGPFVIGQTPNDSGVVAREVWTGVSGSTVASIPVGTAPNIKDHLTSLEAPSGWADTYGTRIRGFITAPSTGNYTFWLATDDNGELWLSTDAQPANKVLISSVPGFTNSREWGKYPAQKSAAIPLIAGGVYYIEVLQKDGFGGDAIAVGWAKPGEGTASPSEVIPGTYLSSYTDSSAMVLAGNITNNSSNLQTLNLDLYVAATRSINCASGDVALSGIIRGAGGLTKSGSNALSLSGANTYSAATLVAAGTVVIGNNAALGSGSAGTTVASGATLNLNGFSLGAEPVAISGSGVGGNGALINTGASQGNALQYLSLNADATVGGSGRFDVRYVTTPLTTASFTGNGFTLTKVGTNQFSLVGVTTASVGNILVSGGIFSLEEDTVMGAGGNLTIENGTSLLLYQNTGCSRPIIVNGNANLLAWPGSAVVSSGSTITVNGGVLTCTSEGTSMTLSGMVDGTGSLVKTGVSPLILSGTNTYSGTTTVSAGTLQNGAAGVIPDGSAVTVASGATYDLNNFNEAIGSLAGVGTMAVGTATLTTGGDNTSTAHSGTRSGTGLIVKTGSGVWTLTGNATFTGKFSIIGGIISVADRLYMSPTPGSTLADWLTLNGGTLEHTGGSTFGPERGVTLGGSGGTISVTGANTPTMSGVISGAGALTKSGTGTLTLSGNNTFSGGTTHTGGYLSLGHSAALGSGSLTSSAGGNSGIRFASGITVSNALIFNSGGTTGVGFFHLDSGTATLSGPITLNAFTTGGGQFGSTGAAVLTVSGAITSTVSGISSRIGIVQFSGSMTGNTSFTIGQGTVRVGVTNALNTTATVDVGASAAGTFDLFGANQTVAAIQRSGPNAGSVTTSTGSSTLTLSSSLPYSYQDPITGAVSLVKNGSGTFTLSGTNTYTGSTTVNAGALSVTGSTAAGSAVTVASGGTLTGSGTVGGTVAVANGGTLAPGVGMGLTASFVATSLRAVTQDDWRLTQTITGTRSDATINQPASAFGTGAERASFGIGGTDADWDNFSVQWDGYLRVITAGTNLSTRSDDGSRVWLDLNGNGTVDSGEWGSNGWGSGQGGTTRTVHSGLAVGTYRMRVQYEEGNGGNLMHLLWNDAANSAGTVDGIYVVPANLLMGGSTIATLTTGAVTFNSTSNFSVDLNGTTPTYDHLNSTGAVTCAGTLTITSMANPGLGKVYTIINAASVGGAFSGLANGAMTYQQGRNFQIAYTATTVTLTDVAHPTTRIWDGGGGDNNWTTAANWDYDIAPIAGDDLQFAGTTRLTPNNDFPGETSFASITFNSGAGAFVIGPTGGSTGVISREVWTGIGTTDISSIPLTTTANINDTLTSLEAPTSWADNYGTRIRGFVTAPTTGNYTFWVASDDNSELRLSTDVQVANKVLIASVTGFTASREWGKYVSQKSAEIALVAGQKYYIEVLHKEGGGSDNLAVGWAKPGEATTAPSEVIPGAYLTPYATNYGIALAGAITNNSTNLQTVNLGLYLGASRSIDCASGNITLGGIVSGSGGLTKVGTNALSLGGANVFAGGVSLNAGTLNLNHASALGTGAGTFVITGGTTIDNTSGASITLTGNNPQTWNGDFTFTGSNALHLGGGAIAMGAATRQVTVSASTLSLGGAIGGAGGLTKQGNGTLRLAGVSTYAGATDVVAGTLALGVPQVSGFGATGTGWSLNGGSTVAGDVLTLTDNNGNQARSAFKTTRVPLGGFTTSFHYQAGGDRAADGTMFVLHNDTRGASALGSPGGALAYAGGGGAITPSAGIAINLYTAVTRGTGYRTGGNVSSPYTSTAPVDLGNGNVIAVTLKYDGTNLLTQTLRDLTTGDTWSTTYTVGDLTTTVGGSSAYVGFTGSTGGQVATQQISSFSFNTGGNNLLPTTTALSIAAGATVDLGGKDQQVASLANYGGAGGSVTNNGMEDSSLTVSGSGSTTFAGVISDGASNQTALVKDGSSTLTLTGTNTFTGTTTITTGTLSIGDGTTDGSIAGSSGITDNAALIYNVVGSRT